ncbi:hypothetical protein PILCRDRAFT_815432, partial [Piloderma croceum F 1598]
PQVGMPTPHQYRGRGLLVVHLDEIPPPALVFLSSTSQNPENITHPAPHTLFTPFALYLLWLGDIKRACSAFRDLGQNVHPPLSPANIERVALGIGIGVSKSPPPLDLAFSASHHLNNLTSHVPGTPPQV